MVYMAWGGGVDRWPGGSGKGWLQAVWKQRSYWALPWAEERSISISGFKPHELFDERVLPNELSEKGVKGYTLGRECWSLGRTAR